MKVTYHWLKEYVAFDWSADELAERLTLLGLEVERTEKRGGEFAGVVVGEVLTRDKHPNADKLSVCQVHDGTGPRQIVCGAQNFQPGDRVALILPGHALPKKPGEKEALVIKVGKIRGVESQGMMCSAEELGLDAESLGRKQDADGILILDKSAPVGQAFATYLGREVEDTVYDLEVTPNRPDLNSVLGIAREIAAVTGTALRTPNPALESTSGKTSEMVSVRVEAPDLCPRYTARVIRGVRIGPSRPWLRNTLEKVGLRSINNVVDVTNYVMLLTGQPLHAFDLHQIARGTDGRTALVIRRAQPGEVFTTLDEKERSLTTNDALIADPQKAIALGGVMGGRNSEVSGGTTDLVLESATFEPTAIRRTSKNLGLRTDASYRFERGADPGAAEWASRVATSLVVAEAGGVAAEGVVDVQSAPVVPRRITLRAEKVGELLGIPLPREQIEAHLSQLGLRAVNRRPRSVDDPAPMEPLVFEVPTFRVDLKRETDLIEEVIRLHGVDKIPAAEPRQARGYHAYDLRHDELMEARRVMAGLGLNEVTGQTLISRGSIRTSGGIPIVLLSNALSSDMDALRPSLLPGLLDIARHNLRHQHGDLALFEVGRVFSGKDSGVDEDRRLGLLLTGARRARFWSGADREARIDASDLKGVVEELLEHLGVSDVAYRRRTEPTRLLVDSAEITLGGDRQRIGELGQVQPTVAKGYDLREPVFVAELAIDLLLARRNTTRNYKPLPAYPSIRRDVAMVVLEAVTHDAVLDTVRQAKVPYLEGVELFDVFRGQQVPHGAKSVAYAFTYRATDRTLTDAEANASHEKVVARLREALSAAIRD